MILCIGPSTQKVFSSSWDVIGPYMVEYCYEALNKCSLRVIIGFVIKEIRNRLAFVKNNAYGAKEDAFCF